MSIKCFWLEPTDREQRYLRRYRSNVVPSVPECPGTMGYHDAMVAIEQAVETFDPVKMHWVDDGKTPEDYKDDPRWPTQCVCGYQFQPSDQWQLFGSHIYKRVDTGEEMTLRDAPEGAMWDATWYHGVPQWCGDDGRAIICRVPTNHDWHIDGTCSNCTRPKEEHKCWVRHGDPPNLTVDKNGNTCAAGAGSVLTSTWHGFLRNGELVT
jgi:hypothetical protein